jgi:hypothetical protein
MKMPNVGERQIENIYTELAVQLKRMAHLQVQIDGLHSAVRKLTAKAD